MPVTLVTWNGVRVELAAYLSPEEYIKVSQVHLFLQAAVDARAGRPLGAPLLPAALTATRATRERLDPVANVLEVRGWPDPNDPAELAAGMKGLPPYTPASNPPTDPAA